MRLTLIYDLQDVNYILHNLTYPVQGIKLMYDGICLQILNRSEVLSFALYLHPFTCILRLYNAFNSPHRLGHIFCCRYDQFVCPEHYRGGQLPVPRAGIWRPLPPFHPRRHSLKKINVHASFFMYRINMAQRKAVTKLKGTT